MSYRALQPRYGLTLPTLLRLRARWPHMTDDHLDRFAVLAQDWRTLKAELVEAHRGFSTAMILAVEPDLTAGSRSSLDPRLFDASHAVEIDS